MSPSKGSNSNMDGSFMLFPATIIGTTRLNANTAKTGARLLRLIADSNSGRTTTAEAGQRLVVEQGSNNDDQSDQTLD